MSKYKVCTIPNLMSFFRILLVPVFVVSYLKTTQDIAIFPIIVLVVSGLTDLFDGLIARRFNMVSDLGKMLDPIADKLTQIAVIACLTIRFQQLIFLLIVYIVKELAIVVGGVVMLKSKQQVPSAKWFGKVSTFEFYLAMALLLVFPNMDSVYITIIVILTVSLTLFSLVMYAFQFFRTPSQKGDNK